MPENRQIDEQRILSLFSVSCINRNINHRTREKCLYI